MQYLEAILNCIPLSKIDKPSFNMIGLYRTATMQVSKFTK